MGELEDNYKCVGISVELENNYKCVGTSVEVREQLQMCRDRCVS